MKKLAKKIAVLLSVAGILGSLTGCGAKSKEADSSPEMVTVKVGLTGTIYEDIWNPIGERLKDEGIILELVQFSDFALPNEALSSGDIQLNAFQHHAYFNNEVESKGYDLTAIGDTFVIAMNAYSDKISDLKELKAGDKIAIPNDATNGGRAIKLLESAGVLALKQDAGSNPSIADIESYQVEIELIEMNAADICAALPDVTAAVINGNYALDYGIDPEKAIYHETEYADDSYFCLIAVRTEDAENEVYKRIVEEFQSEETKQIFKDKFKGYFVPAWEK